jgi:hypothetical protein
MKKFTFLLIAAMLLGLFANAQKSITPASAEGGEIWTPAKTIVNQNRTMPKGTEDFEGDFLPFGWSETAIERSWGRSSNATFQINGLSALIGQTINNPEEMLITPPLTLDGTVTTFSYHAKGVNNTYGFGSSSLVLKYKLVGDDTWTDLGDAIDFANGEADTLLEQDLSGFADGNYYFAFAATSTFDYLTYTSYVLIDDVVAPDAMDLNTVTFNVTDGADPREGADVAFGDQTRTTDATGVAVFGLLDGTYDWTASIYGYYEETGSETIAGADATVNVALNIMPVVTFNVTDGTDPLEGVTITIDDGQIITTDETGEATASLDDGTYAYTASLAAYNDETGSVIVSGADISEPVTMTLKPVYTVTFNVTDGTDALEGASIVVASDTLATDVSGVATIDLYDGDWPWAVTMDGYYDSLGTVTVADAAIGVDVALEFAPTYVGIINTDDFESYTDGDLLGATSDYWGTWSGPDGGGDDDAAISSNFALSGDNSLNIVPDKDMVYPLGDKTSGKYMISYYMLIEAGNEGYYNFQRTATPNDMWMYDVYFDGDGSGRLSIDQTDAATFVYPEGKWFYVNQVIDLDNDRASLSIDGEFVFSWMYSQDGTPENIQLGGINFYGAAGVSYYLDDIEYKQMIFTDDFESYTAGDLVAENSDYWGTWSGPAGGTGDDAEASEDYANTPVTSMKIGDDGADDMILPLGDATSGKYHIGFSILVESGGFEGYYNFQKTTTPGDEYAFDVYFNTDGTGSVEAGSGTMAFNFNQDEFNKIDHYIDLDNDSAYLYVNEMPIFSWQYSLDAAGDPGLNQLGGVDFYAWSDLGTGRSYIDDVVYGEYTWLPAEIVGATTTFSVTTMDSEPIENATIEVNGATLTTDATGLASIDLFDGNYNYTVTHPDYLTIESSVLVEGAEQTVDVMMQAVYNVTFNIDMTDAAGFDAESNFVWVSGASVDGEMGIGEFNPWQLPGAGAGIKLLDEDGDLTFTAIVPRVIPGDYEFRYYWTAGAPSNENGFPEEAEEALTFTVVDEDIAINTVWNGIDDVEALNYSIYPNPTNGEVNVTVNEACEVTVTNMLGQTVLIKTLNSNGTINLLDQRSGVYFVTAKTASRTATLKVLLK